MSCGKSKAVMPSPRPIRSTGSKPAKVNSGRRVTFGSPFGSPKVRMSFFKRT